MTSFFRALFWFVLALALLLFLRSCDLSLRHEEIRQLEVCAKVCGGSFIQKEEGCLCVAPAVKP